ncbi:hypothetical protein Tco_0297606, partial [Tanacetum coccineum]
HKKVANPPRPNSGDSGSSNSYVNAVKNHKSVDHDSPAIVLDEDCALSKDLSSSLMGRIKEFASLTNLKNAVHKSVLEIGKGRKFFNPDECKLLRGIVGSLRIFLCEIERGIPR